MQIPWNDIIEVLTDSRDWWTVNEICRMASDFVGEPVNRTAIKQYLARNCTSRKFKKAKRFLEGREVNVYKIP